MRQDFNGQTKVIVQGITGSAARIHTKAMLAYGTQIVAGVTPGKGGQTVLGVPVFDSVLEAVQATGATVSIVFVPAPYAADAIYEAVSADLEWVICITEHIPMHDMLKVNAFMKGRHTKLLGPNCPGLIVPDEMKLGIMPGDIHKLGDVGIVSRSGTLTYEAVATLSEAGIGQSVVVGIGGDPIKGTDYIEVLKQFEADSNTKTVLLIGEIGGESEEAAAKWIKAHMTKPVFGFISGKSAPVGKTMGHAGAIMSDEGGSAVAKEAAFRACGITVLERLSDMIMAMKALN